MSFIDYFLGGRKKTASIAKERLQIILAHERAGRGGAPDYLPALKEEIIGVVAKYLPIDPEQIKVSLDRRDDVDVLELNILLPEAPRAAPRARS